MPHSYKYNQTENMVFVDVIKNLGMSHPGFRVGPTSNDWCPYQRKEEDLQDIE